MFGDTGLQPETLLDGAQPPLVGPQDFAQLVPELWASPPRKLPFAELPYDTWGAIRIPTTANTVFVPQAPSLWVAPAAIPSADPALAVILDWLATFLITDGNAMAAWQQIGGANPTPLRRVFAHDPTEAVFSDSHLPALYMWRESSEQVWAADDWLDDDTTIKSLWVYPLAQQKNQQVRQPYINALAKCIGTGIERGRTPGWQQPVDPDPRASVWGSLFYTFANFSAFWLQGYKRSQLTVQAADGAGASRYPAIELTFRMQETLDYGLGRQPPYYEATGASMTITNPQGRVVDAGPLDH